MPMYEYISEDGETVELLRSMKDADTPVEDPAGKGRRFTRKMSTFMTGREAGGDRNGMPGRPSSGGGGGCGCCCGPGGCGH